MTCSKIECIIAIILRIPLPKILTDCDIWYSHWCDVKQLNAPNKLKCKIALLKMSEKQFEEWSSLVNCANVNYYKLKYNCYYSSVVRDRVRFVSDLKFLIGRYSSVNMIRYRFLLFIHILCCAGMYKSFFNK